MEELEISYRDFPPKGLFKKKYREDIYRIEEFKDDFNYYENNPIEKIIIDEHHLLPFTFFSPEGINYLMPRIIVGICNDIKSDDITTNIEEFIVGISSDENINNALNFLVKNEILVLKEHLEKILFGDSPRLIQQIGEYYLFRSIEYLEKLLHSKS